MSNGRWFRFYDETLNNTKALKLSDKSFRVWVGLLCAASKNDGILPLFDDLVILLRTTPAKLQPEIEKLIAAELLDHDDTGMRPHDWDERQYKSDVSNDRVKRHRERKRNNDVTLLKRPQITEADTESETDKKDIRTVAKATRPDDFEEFWKVYPKRQGANPKSPARKLFLAAVKQGADPPVIIEGARRCAVSDHDKVGTPYIPQAVKWLRDQRWNDYATDPPGNSGLSDDERKKMFEKLRGTNGKLEREGNDIRGAGAGARQVEGAGRQEPTIAADHQTGHSGMAGVDAVFRDAPGVRASGDEAGPAGDEPGIHGPR